MAQEPSTDERPRTDTEYRGTLILSDKNAPTEAWVDLVQQTLEQSAYIETERSEAGDLVVYEQTERIGWVTGQDKEYAEGDR